METPASSTQPAVPVPLFEPPAPSVLVKSSASSQTQTTQTPPDAPSTPDRVIVRCGDRIEVITYTQEGAATVAVSPRRALQLAHDLICNALRMSTP